MEAEVKRVLSLLREMEKTMNSVNTSKLSQEEKEIVDREISLFKNALQMMGGSLKVISRQVNMPNSESFYAEV
jgi:hypothetical protein|tara:strand:- start:128 stop:346 length:219 start_codon:yes stop_codon:yes gene_type:complete